VAGISNFSYAQLRGNPNIDPAMVDRIMRNSSMLSEQGSGWLAGWGGPAAYMVLARLPIRERLVYAAVLDGYSVNADIADVTGLALSDVSGGLSSLKSKGIIQGQVKSLL